MLLKIEIPKFWLLSLCILKQNSAAQFSSVNFKNGNQKTTKNGLFWPFDTTGPQGWTPLFARLLGLWQNYYFLFSVTFKLFNANLRNADECKTNWKLKLLTVKKSFCTSPAAKTTKIPPGHMLEGKRMCCILGKKKISKAFIKPISHTGKLLSYGHTVCLRVEEQIPTAAGNPPRPAPSTQETL